MRRHICLLTKRRIVLVGAAIALGIAVSSEEADAFRGGFGGFHGS